MHFENQKTNKIKRFKQVFFFIAFLTTFNEFLSTKVFFFLMKYFLMKVAGRKLAELIFKSAKKKCYKDDRKNASKKYT